MADEAQVQDVAEAPKQEAEDAASQTAEMTPEKKSQIERIEEEEHYVHKQVKSISFSMLSPAMIKKMSSAKVVTPELYDKEGYPVDGGLMDIRLGAIDPGLKCKTCSSKLKECIGHFGYIELARPVIHVKLIRIIQILLKCCCKDCGRVMIPEDKIAKYSATLNRVESE